MENLVIGGTYSKRCSGMLGVKWEDIIIIAVNPAGVTYARISGPLDQFDQMIYFRPKEIYKSSEIKRFKE